MVQIPKRKLNEMQLTQHANRIPQQRPRIIVPDHHLEQPQLHDVVDPDQILGYLPQRVEMSHPYVRRQPWRGGAVGYVDVETVELRCGREGACEVEEPDAVG